MYRAVYRAPSKRAQSTQRRARVSMRSPPGTDHPGSLRRTGSPTLRGRCDGRRAGVRATGRRDTAAARMAVKQTARARLLLALGAALGLALAALDLLGPPRAATPLTEDAIAAVNGVP